MRRKRGLRGVDLNNRYPVIERLERKSGGGIDEVGCANREKEVRSASGHRSRLQCSPWQHFAEPHHVGSERGPARRTNRGRLPVLEYIDPRVLCRTLRAP